MSDMQVKVQFSKKNMTFYLHNNHLRSSLGACYAGKSEGCQNKISLLPAKRTREIAVMQVKVMFLLIDFRALLRHE